MNKFTIRDIENLSGIRAHTLRIWEQRYNLIIPKRKESNHRFYDSDDLKHILRISYLYHNGLKISKIARLQKDAIEQYISDTAAHTANDLLINQLMEASLDFDEQKFERVLTTALQVHDLESTMLDVVYPFLEKIGLLWLTEHLIPAQEHFSSNILCRKILAATDKLTTPKNDDGKITLLYSPEMEHHEIGLLFLRYLLKKYGHRVVYFGSNVPISDLEMYCNHRQVDCLQFHLITSLQELSPDEYLATLSRKFPGKTIIMSGPIAEAVTTSGNNIRLLKSLQEMLTYIRN